MSKNGQLHEVLAVEKNLATTAQKLSKESIRTLGKEGLFSGFTKTLSHFDGSQSHLDTVDEMKLETTVDENIEYLLPVIGQYWDAVYQKDNTNMQARADIIVDGKTIAMDVPVTFLLGLETKLVELRHVYNAAHTLPPGRVWVEDTSAGKGVFVTARPEISFKTEKVTDFQVVYEATKEHPAQIREVGISAKVGKYETTNRSGLWTPAEKARRLANLDKLITAVKRARQRANTQDIVKGDIAQKLFDVING